MRGNLMISLPLVALLSGCVNLGTHDLISDEAHYARRLAQLDEARARTVLPAAELSLAEVIAHVLKRNARHRAALLEEVTARYDLTVAQYELLPAVAAQAAYSWRSNSPELIDSPARVDVESWRFDLGLQFNLLDFGISYYVAKQAAAGVMAAAERRNGVLRRIVWEAEVAFWEAALAQRLLPRVTEVLAAAEQALETSRAGLGLRNILAALRYQQGLLDVVRRLRQLEGRLRGADATLASLLSLPPTQRVRCALPGARRLERLAASELPALERLVLARRADLRELAYQERIDLAEVKRKMVEMVPGVALVGGLLNHDTSSAVMHRNWQAAGLQVSKNLMEVFTGTSQRRVDRAQAQLEMNRQRALALSVAALAQLHTGFWDWHSKRALYLLADELQGVAGQIVSVMSHQAASGVLGELSHIQADVNLLQVELERDLAYVALRRSLGQIFVAVGLDPVGDLDIDAVAVSELSARIDEYLAGRMALLKSQSADWGER